MTRVQLKLNTLTPIIQAVRIQGNTTPAIYKILTCKVKHLNPEHFFKIKNGKDTNVF